MVFEVTTTGGEIGALAFQNPMRPQRTIRFPPRSPENPNDPVMNTLKRGLGGLAAGKFRGVSLDSVPSISEQNGSLGKLLQRVEQVEGREHIITAGLPTILETAASISRFSGARGKRIVLVGANTPLLNCGESDGFQNLRFAFYSLLESTPQADRAPTGVSIVLSDHVDKPGSWEPRLFPFIPGVYVKANNPDRADRTRLVDTRTGARELRQIVLPGGHVMKEASYT
jgi:hypothetical protein